MSHQLTEGVPHRGASEPALKAALEISQSLNLELELDAMLQHLAYKVHTLMNCDCAVVLLDPETLVLTWAGSYGLSDGYIRRMNEQLNNLATDAMSHGATGRAYRTKQTVQITDLNESSMELWRDYAIQEGVTSFTATPMVRHDAVLGFINCYSRTSRVFSQAEISLLSIIGYQAAIAVDAARLHEEARHRARELSHLNDRLQAQNELLSAQHAELVQAAQIHRELTEVILQDGGLARVAHRISNLVGLPVLVFDATAQEVFTSESDLFPEAHYRAQSEPLENTLSKLRISPVDPDGMGRLINGGGSERLEYSVGDGLIVSGYTVTIWSGNTLLGYMIVFELGGQVEGLGYRAVEHGTTVVTLELVKQRAVIEAEQQLRGGFLDNLLAGEFDSEASIRRRAGYLGFDFDTAYRVIVIAIDDTDVDYSAIGLTIRETDELRNRVLGSLVSWLSIGCPTAAATLRGDNIVVVWPENGAGVSSPTEATGLIKRVISQALGGLSTSIGVGSRCTHPASFSRSFSEARYCLNVLKSFGNSGRTLAIEDLGLYRFLVQPQDGEELLDFAHRRIDGLIAYEMRYGGGLLETLTTYLNCGCGLTKTANTLNVHVNTVQYRLKRVEDLTGVGIRSPHGLMEIYLSLIVAALNPKEFPDLGPDAMVRPTDLFFNEAY